MSVSYREFIRSLISECPFDIDMEAQVKGNPPTMASSEFLTNKEQGDWAEEIVLKAINECSEEYCALRYGRADSIAAGDPGFSEFYTSYQNELNTIGKKPDILIFHREDVTQSHAHSIENEELVQSAVAAIEVRSSSFLSTKYSAFMDERNRHAESECGRIRNLILREPYSETLKEKSPPIHKMIAEASVDTFREIDFRARSWSSSQTLRELSEYLKDLKSQIKILHKRDYLGIIPKVEDIVLVNRWIQNFGVPHYYLQVFFDKAYVIPFRNILELIADPKNEGVIFSMERDVKNQGKTTIKVNINVGKEILRRIDMPEHQSILKELDRGRLLFYVTFKGGKGYLDSTIFFQDIVNGA